MKKMLFGIVVALLASASMADVITVAANTNDQQWSGSSATNAAGANVSQATARTGSATLPGTYSYVIPFQLPVLPDGQSITNVSLSAFLTAVYTGNGTGAYVDVFAGRTAATSATVASDWDYEAMTMVGDNIAKILKNAETNNTLKTATLTAAFFQNIYNTDSNAAGKYVFLTVAPESKPAGSSQYIEWATANNATVTNRPVLSITTVPTVAVALVSLSNTNQTYDGTAKSVTVSTVPTNLSVSVTYNGSATVPSNAATYTVVATVNDAIYQGGATGSLIIAKASQTVSFANIGSQITTNVVTLSATASSGLSVTNFSVVSGPAAVNGSTLSFTNSGSVTLSAVQNGNSDWNASAATSISFNVTKAVALVSLSNMNQTYDGTAKSVTVSTVPANLPVSVTYNGSEAVPSNAATYAVVATVSDAMYQGEATGSLMIANAIPIIVADWYVDAANGSDTNNGSCSAPYRTITNLWPRLEAGDTVGLFGGSYGGFDYYTGYAGDSPPDIFTNWVTFKAVDPENPPVFDYVHMGLGIGNVALVPAVTGPPTAQANACLAFEGLQILDGVYIERLANVRFKGCRITLQLAAGFVNIDPDFPDADYVAEIERYAVEYNRAEHFYLEQCEVTESAHGVGGSGMDINIVSNEIHHLRHDGVRVWGCWNSRIEGNRIYNTDPLLTDDEAHVLYPEVNAARHADNIHVAISGTGPINTNVVIRNNIIYDTAGQNIQFNEYGSLRNENFTIEGNIFGPSEANLLNHQGRGLIFRNNTVCVLPEPRILNEGTRTNSIIVGTNVIRQAGTQNNIVMDNYVMRIASIASGVELYNNILGSYAADQGSIIGFSDYNVLQIEPSTPPMGVDISRALGRFTTVNTNSPLLNPDAFDGVLLSNAVQVINRGTHSRGQIDFADVAGTSRDNRPDLGAWEMPGLSPSEESVPQVIGDLKTVFLDDFEDGHYNDIDLWLNGTNTQGMSWYRPAEFTNAWDKFLVTHSDSMLDRNALFMPNSPYARSSWMISEQGTNWSDYTFEFDCANTYVTTNCGATVLTLDQDNAYWLDISRDSGRLIRIMNGVETVLAASSAIEMPHSGTKHYKIDVGTGASGITFDVATNGVPVFSFTDTNSAALATFTAGGVGFHYDLPEGNFRMHFDNVRVELRPEGYEAPPVASFSADPVSGGSPLSVTFTDASTRTITNRYWDFGDGAVTNTTATTLTHTYTSTGTYSVVLVVSGPGGTDTASTQIEALFASVADVIAVTAHADDQQWSGSSATNATGANVSQATARTGSATLPGTYSYVIPFQLPVLPDGQSITNVSLSAFLTAVYTGNGTGAYVDVFAGRTAATSATVAADWDYGAMTTVGNNIARILKNAETNNTLKTATLNAAFFQNIYDSDPDAAGKYIFLTLAPDATPAGSSQFIEWATANNATVTNRPVLSFFLTSSAGRLMSELGMPMRIPLSAPAVGLGSDALSGGRQDVISWTTVQGSGYVYSVYYSTNLLNGFQPLETNLPDTVQSLTNTINASSVFYKIEVQEGVR